jgi:hypothetical protein
MSRNAFPEVSPQLAAIEMRLSGALSLKQVHEAIETLTDLSAKTGEAARNVLASGLFEAAMQRTEELSCRELEINHQICQNQEELNDLAIAKDRLDPEQMEAALEELRKKIFSCSEPSTPRLQKQLDALKAEWLHLQFLYKIAWAEELDPDSFQVNVFHRLIMQIHAAKGKAALHLKEQLHMFLQIFRVAEELFGAQNWNAFKKLPETFKLAVEQRFFSLFPGVSIHEIMSEMEPSIGSRAIMSVLSDQMVRDVSVA